MVPLVSPAATHNETLGQSSEANEGAATSIKLAVHEALSGLFDHQTLPVESTTRQSVVEGQETFSIDTNAPASGRTVHVPPFGDDDVTMLPLVSPATQSVGEGQSIDSIVSPGSTVWALDQVNGPAAFAAPPRARQATSTAEATARAARHRILRAYPFPANTDDVSRRS